MLLKRLFSGLLEQPSPTPTEHKAAVAAIKFDKKYKLSLYHSAHVYNLDANDDHNVITPQNRVTSLQHHSYKGSLYAATGTTFFTNNQRKIAQYVETPGHAATIPTLDAAFTALLSNGDCVLAIADGCAGHAGEAEQDEAIAYVAHSATKTACQVLNTYSNSQQLAQDLASHVVLGKIKERMLDKINHKANGTYKRFKESTTLGAARIFKEADGLKVMGFNIGDSMLIAWSPSTQKFTVLASAMKLMTEGQGHECIAMFPDTYKPEEVQIFSAWLPSDSTIFGVTDFITEHLPTLTTERLTEDDSLNYTLRQRITLLDPTFMTELFSQMPDVTHATNYGQLIVKTAFKIAQNQLEEMRLRSKKANMTLGELEAEIQAFFQMKDGLDDTAKHENSTLKQLEQAVNYARADAYIQHGDDVGIVGVSLNSAGMGR